jgi:hypothetical protein
VARQPSRRVATRNPQDATRRNVQASMKRHLSLAAKIAALAKRVDALERAARR